jgi:glycogen operon protein
VHGPFDPRGGHRFNRHKLLLDPYARAIDRPFRLHPSMFGHVPGDRLGDLSFSEADSAPDMPKAFVLAPLEQRGTARRWARPWRDTSIYELHVKGFTRLNEALAPELRGTLSGLARPEALDHIVKLGVSAIEIMPIAAFIDEERLVRLGLSNYWGYNPVAFFAIDPRYAPQDAIETTRAAVEAIHEADLEVILDVVFNHTGESDELGPTICYRGIDNRSYYRARPDDERYYDNASGCGNVLALDREPVLRLVMDALRYWKGEIGVDGFRFDLATTLGRGAKGFDPNGAFFAAVRQDPLLASAKIVVEPWDVGPDGYQGGAFPPGIAEWNDRCRDDVRRFWRGDGRIADLASRLAGSSDRFAKRRRQASESVNYIASHDGFTLADLVSYERKRNEPNGEGNADGASDNFSWNNGTEGPSEDKETLAARSRDMRALLATLFVSLGTPMLRSGDELGQSQGGNNNAYAQDNETTWIDWRLAEDNAELVAFVRRLATLRKQHRTLTGQEFLKGELQQGATFRDVAWRKENSDELQVADWQDGARRFVAMELFQPENETDARPDHLYVIVNGGEACSVTLPSARGRWRLILDSMDVDAIEAAVGLTIAIGPRSVVVLSDDAVSMPLFDPRALDQLALAAGIEPEHRDANGRRHIVNADTKRALLQAMDVPASNAGEIRESLERLTSDPWRSDLAPFIVARAGHPFSIEIVVDAREAAGEKTATLVLETGEARSIIFRPSDGVLIGKASIGGSRREKWRVRLGFDLPIGLHRLSVGEAEAILAATPGRMWIPPAIDGEKKRWGVSVNLYSVRSPSDWGIGDFAALRQLVEDVSERGGALVGVNPLHALFPDQPERASPYYPSDRRFLDPIYIDPRTLPGYAELASNDPWFAGAGAKANELRAAAFIDYSGVIELKRAIYARAWRSFRNKQGQMGAIDKAYANFIADGGATLARFAAFHAEGRDGAEGDAGFHTFLQWRADLSLAEAAQAATLSIGLYRDLAVGPAPDGAERATGRAWFADKVSIGAPPDPYSETGQVWGVPPHNPMALRRRGFLPWVELVRANMRHAGALRLDHVMGIERLLWVPEGATANDGAYVRNDAEALLAVLAILSHRRRCLIVGEDLGTVPSGFRERMAEAGLFSMSVMLFERDGDQFRKGERYAARSFACWATHDLPPFHGWWGDHANDGDGGALRRAVSAEAGSMDALGECDRAARAVSIATHEFLAATPAKIAIVQLDDLAEEQVPVNVPGTTLERPNWRRRMTKSVKDILEGDHAKKLLGAISAGRTAEPAKTVGDGSAASDS